ncbi:sphingomyelinase C 1-like [Anneissia japonica]|uniref:sphingomyelinase C 1-like n=1 Tax=Anneissia japonica TaxID=1529436 RepID=UPI0014257468|nr:sphingomyelinase C 1-like [Anneissia japonica]
MGCHILFLLFLYGSGFTFANKQCLGQNEELQKQGRPFVWLGDGPDCQVNTEDCQQFGFKYLCSDAAGGSNSEDVCESGYKVLCAPPSTKGLASPTPSNHFKTVSLNALELDFEYSILFVNFHQYIGQRERTCRIPDILAQLQPDVDAIVFQEIFVGGCFPDTLDIRELLSYYGFKYNTPTVGINDNSFLNFENGGVFIASRWPIEEYKEMIFDAADFTTADNYASKGVMYARISKLVEEKSCMYNLFGTHMQSQEGQSRENVREAQAIEILRFVEELGIPSSEAVIIAGDFNANLNGSPDHARAVISNMGTVAPTITGSLTTTFDITENNLISIGAEAHQWLDYVVYSGLYLQPLQASLEAFKVHVAEPFLICTDAGTGEYVHPLSADCHEALSTKFLSDHYGVAGTFIFPTDKMS